jgi:hypothetical protein
MPGGGVVEEFQWNSLPFHATIPQWHQPLEILMSHTSSCDTHQTRTRLPQLGVDLKILLCVWTAVKMKSDFSISWWWSVMAGSSVERMTWKHWMP